MATAEGSSETSSERAPWASRLAVLVAVGLCGLHAIGAWVGVGGWEGLSSEWPLAIHDHPVHFHSSVVAERFLWQSGTTAGYDPSFMAGYPKNLLFPQSSTMFDVTNFLTGGRWPVQVFKAVVFLALASVPWLIALAGWIWGLRPGAVAVAVALVLVYGWTEGGGANFPWNYAWYGMSAYLLAVPLSVVAVAAFSRYLGLGGWTRWVLAAVLISLSLLVHVTTPMILGPAGLVGYLGAVWRARRSGGRLPAGRHAGVWAFPVVALAVNAFWWWPALGLLSMSGDSAILFKHEESVVGRVAQILSETPPVQAVLVALVPAGLVVMARRDRIGALCLGGLALAGFGWGYLAGFFRAVDFLQPGRQTYAFYVAAAVLGGVVLDDVVGRVRQGAGRLDLWLATALLLLGTRLFGPSLSTFVPIRLGWAKGSKPFLSSEPTPTFLWVLRTVQKQMKPGERLLYEEGGESVEGEPDPFNGGRYSGLLPYLAGVELLGGPYLKVSLTTNFTQFGEGRLFGRRDWDEAYFRKYASIYRPDAILCWSSRAVAFCKAHPELVEVVDSLRLERSGVDPRTGMGTLHRQEILFGRIKGYGGSASRGEAKVEAEAGRLAVTEAKAEELGGLVVLRYHWVPRLVTDPPVAVEPVRLADDPVPFIGFRPPGKPFSIRMRTVP